MLTTTSVADPDLLLFYLDPDTALLCKNDSFYTTSFRPKKYLLFSNWYCNTINILHCHNKNRNFIVVSWVHCPNKISLLKKKHFCLFILYLGTVCIIRISIFFIFRFNSFSISKRSGSETLVRAFLLQKIFYLLIWILLIVECGCMFTFLRVVAFSSSLPRLRRN